MHQETIYVPKETTHEKPAEHVDPPKFQRNKSLSPYCSHLKTILLEKDKKKAYNSLYDISKMLYDARPQYKSLEDELVAIIKAELKDETNKEAEPLKFIISNLLEAYEIAYLEDLHDMLNHLLITVLSRLKEKFSNMFTKEVNDILLRFWTKVDSYHMSKYLETFELSNLVKYEDMIPVIKDLIHSQYYEDAANFIAMFKLHKHFDIQNLLAQLVENQDFAAISYFVEDDPDLQKKAINELIFSKNSSQAGDLVKKYNFDPYQFPDLIPNLEKSSLRYHARNAWFVVEEKFFDQKHILGYYVEDLIRKKDFDVALSIIVRHKLHKQEGMIRKSSLNVIAPYLKEPPTKSFKYMENQLFKFDDFAPTEEIIREAQPGTYLHLRDFGFDMKKDIIFIDDSESEAFDLAIKDLISSEAVGLDSEFKFTMTKFDFQPTALLQLANHKKIYLIDSIKLMHSSKYNDFITELLDNPAIQKVGHTLTADLYKLRVTRDKDTPPLKIQNEVDIAKIYRKLHPEKQKYGLASICEHYLKKPMSKYDQISNWSHRPLRKAQMHYGGLDAFIVLNLFNKLKEQILSKGEDVKTYLEDPVAQKKEPKERIRKPRSKKEHKEIPTEEVKLDEENLGDATQSSETKHKNSRRRPYQSKNEPTETEDESHRGGQKGDGLQEEPKKTKGKSEGKMERHFNDAVYVKEYKPKKKSTSKNPEETAEKKN